MSFAQRPGSCGTACPCQVGNVCIPPVNGICYERGCVPGKDSPCCKSAKVRPPTAAPTAVRPPTAVPTSNVPITQPLTGNPVDPNPSSPVQPPVGGSPTGGDCSSSVEGVPDGKVDLLDFNLLRKEFGSQTGAVKCDFDANGIVNLLDFNIFRIAFIAQGP